MVVPQRTMQKRQCPDRESEKEAAPGVYPGAVVLSEIHPKGSIAFPCNCTFCFPAK